MSRGLGDVYKRQPEQPIEPKQPEQPEINYDKAMASLTEAIEKKVAELGTNNDAKKKLVEITDKAIAAIQEAKTQEDVNKALNNALEQIKQLQPSQPEQPVEPKQPEKPITSSSPEEGVKELVFQLPSLDIVKKAVPFKTIRHENPNLDKGKEQVLAKGKDGAIIEYVEVYGSNRKVVQTESTPPLDRVIEVGTKQSSVGTDTPPVVTLPKYVLPRETEKLAPVVVTEDSPRKDGKTPVATMVKQDKEKQLPETGEQEANAFLFLAAITSVLSLLIFQKNLKD